MDPLRAHYLASPVGRAALAEISPDEASLPLTALSTALRRRHTPEEAAALTEQVTLRERARDRFGNGRGLLYSADGLEMMTHPAVAARRAERLRRMDLPVIDLTCGIGGDLLAATEAGLAVTGMDRDIAAATLAAANVPGADIVAGDAVRPPFDLAGSAVIIDPARRKGVRRSFDPSAYSPPWDVALARIGEARAGVLKTAPGIDHAQIPDSVEVEFVQFGRSLREAALWAGEGARPALRTAVLLPGQAVLSSDDEEAPAETVAPRGFILDPESCVTRAGLVRHLAHAAGARLMDPQVAYLTADGLAPHPMAATFEVLEAVPFSVSRLRRLLRDRGWRADEIRRRAFPVEPDELRRLLGGREGEPVTLICTTIEGQRTVFVTQRVDW